MLSSAIKKWIENKIIPKVKHTSFLTIGGVFLLKSQQKLKKKSPLKGAIQVNWEKRWSLEKRDCLNLEKIF